MNFIDQFAQNHNTTRYQISKKANIAQSTLLTASKGSVDNLRVKTIKALAKGVEITPEAALKELINIKI